MLAPIRRIEFIEPHCAAFIRRVNETAFADVNADMAHVRAAMKKYDVAGLKVIACDGRRIDATDLPGAARQDNPRDVVEHIVDQSAAVETAGRCVAAITIGRADEANGAKQNVIRIRVQLPGRSRVRDRRRGTGVLRTAGGKQCNAGDQAKSPQQSSHAQNFGQSGAAVNRMRHRAKPVTMRAGFFGFQT